MATLNGTKPRPGKGRPESAKSAGTPTKHSERTARTKAKLIEAAVASLIEHGYAHTTTVEICARAGLTRGAYNHHYTELSQLFSDVLEELYSQFMDMMPASRGGDASLVEVLEALFSVRHRPEFKAVIELWLAARNDPEVGKDLRAQIDRLSLLFAPSSDGELITKLSADPKSAALYSLAFEALLGLALGRATTPGGAAVAHEDAVVELLLSLAAEQVRAGTGKRARSANRPRR